MKKVISILLLVALTLLCSSCGNAANDEHSVEVVPVNGEIRIGSIRFSTDLVEKVEKQNDNGYVFTLVENEAWMTVLFFDVSEYGETTQEAYAEMLQDTWLEKYPDRIDSSKLETVYFDGKPIDFLIYGVDDSNGNFQYHVAGSFCFKGYAYTIAYISAVPDTDATEKFVVTIENSDFLTNGINYTPKPTEKEKEVYRDDSLSSAIFDVSFATEREKAALEEAQNYLSISAFSREGLVDQLMFEGFTEKEANFAIEHLIIDWKAQAVSMAKSYLLTSALSYSGMIKQLEFEKFTEEQAKYGAQYCNANWKDQAVKCAEGYRDIGLSGQDLYEQLLFEGFSRSQAEYGVNNSK